MKRKQIQLLFFNVILLGTINAQGGQVSAEVEALFKTKCGICHTIGGGRLVGPDLAKVRDRRSDEWLLSFILSPLTKIKSGDSVATTLFKEYNEVLMPDPLISEAEIKSMLDYVSLRSEGTVPSFAQAPSVIADATDEDWANGKQLFEGRVRLINGGPACISCHNGLSDVSFSEKSFSAKDISASFSNLGEAGVKAILQNPPFPVMTKAFEEHEMTDAEIHDLLVFLQDNRPKSALSSGYLLFGILGACTLLVLYTFFWSERKDRSVNHAIYERQIKSFN